MVISRYNTGIVALSLVVVIFTVAGTGVTTATAATAPSAEQLDGDGTKDDPYRISTLEELQAASDEPYAHYVLTDDIDAEETETWDFGSGFDPIGDSESPFTGTFDGQDHTIRGLTIDRSQTEHVGLFGYSEGTIENVTLDDVDVRGGEATGSVVGETTGTVRGVSATGTVEGTRSVGGLVGELSDGGAVIERSGAAVDVVGGDYVGGVAGYVDGSVRLSYATGDVIGDLDSAEDDVGLSGGVVGALDSDGEMQLTYATGDVTHFGAGGLIGGHGPVRESYAVGDVTGDFSEGGISSFTNDDGPAIDTYWDIDATGQRQSDSDDEFGTGLRTDELTGIEATRNMDGFDFEHFWAATDEYPVLQWQVQDVSVTLDDSTVTEGDRTDVTVTLTLDDGSTVTASEVADYETDGGAAVDAGVVETRNHGTTEITATVAGESDSTTLEVTEPPNIELADASIEAPAVVNDSKTAVPVTATYANDGGPGGHTAELVVDGETVASERIWVGADDETTVEFAWTPNADAGAEHAVSIDDTDLGTLTVVSTDAVTLESLSVPDEVGSGTSYEVTADLATDHDEPVLATVVSEFEGDSAVETAVIDPDDSTAVFEYESDADVGSTLAHAVSFEGETVEATSEIAEPPTFEITAVDVPDEVSAGEEFELAVTIENTGDIAGTQQVAVSAAGDEVGATNLALEADSSDTVSVAVTENEAADYEYTVATDADEATVSVTVAEAEESSNGSESSDGSESDDGSDGLPGFTTGVTLAALLVIVIFARRQ